MDAPNGLRWSRTNFEEAMPGVLTPLSWSFWGCCSEASTRRIMCRRFGVFRDGELTDSLADTMTTLFYGRAAANLDLMARAVSRIPGSDVEAFERQLFGEVTGAAPPEERRLRPFLLLPRSTLLAPRRVRATRRDVDSWWQRSVTMVPDDLDGAVRLARDALARFVHAMTEHGFAGMVGQAFYQQLASIAAEAGLPGLELQLVASGRGLEETRMADDLRAAAQGRLSLDDVVRRHGFHGPEEGEISSRSWREDPSPLRSMIERIGAGEERSAEEVSRRRRDAEEILFSHLGKVAQARARLALQGVDTFLPLRETGKAAFLQCVDVARHAARTAGQLLARTGRLSDEDDVRFLTLDEIAAGGIDHDRLEARRRRRTELLSIDVPLQWIGQPDVSGTTHDDREQDASTVRGIPGSGGVHRGTARVIRGPQDYDRLEPGDVLVCTLTDPAWTPLFTVAGAVVVDVGSALSHGAIVAREMGVPCVIGTGNGTATIPDGAEVEVDGDHGRVRVLSPPS
jgi:pyruvate,water dikinase